MEEEARSSVNHPRVRIVRMSRRFEKNREGKKSSPRPVGEWPGEA